MKFELDDLYQEVILDHNRRPRNFHAIVDASHRAEGYNPLCGDRLTLYLKVDGDVISDAAFEGSGCAISKASASLMTDAIKGRTVPDARLLFDRFHHMVTASHEIDADDLGKLTALAGVRAFPVRIKCASLAWHTFKAALEGDQKASSE
jgi:nitrogen fixation NifU-like protein